MNPTKNPLWIKMKKLMKLHYKKINFQRFTDNKFVEDNNELQIIGKEIIDILRNNIKEDKLFFIDICGAPGNYSELILSNFKSSNGIGISLPPEKGGVHFEIKNDNYRYFYEDILSNNFNFKPENKLDLGIASCVSYEIKNNAYQLNLNLIITSLLILLKNLKTNGNIVINLTIKNIYFAYNIVYILGKLFNKSIIWKSKLVWPDKNTFYFFGFGFNEKMDYIKMLEDILLILQNNNFLKNSYFNRVIMNESNYNIINNKMNNIYKIKIDYFLNLK